MDVKGRLKFALVHQLKNPFLYISTATVMIFSCSKVCLTKFAQSYPLLFKYLTYLHLIAAPRLH